MIDNGLLFLLYKELIPTVKSKRETKEIQRFNLNEIKTTYRFLPTKVAHTHKRKLVIFRAADSKKKWKLSSIAGGNVNAVACWGSNLQNTALIKLYTRNSKFRNSSHRNKMGK